MFCLISSLASCSCFSPPFYKKEEGGQDKVAYREWTAICAAKLRLAAGIRSLEAGQIVPSPCRDPSRVRDQVWVELTTPRPYEKQVTYDL